MKFESSFGLFVSRYCIKAKLYKMMPPYWAKPPRAGGWGRVGGYPRGGLAPRKQKDGGGQGKSFMSGQLGMLTSRRDRECPYLCPNLL